VYAHKYRRRAKRRSRKRKEKEKVKEKKGRKTQCGGPTGKGAELPCPKPGIVGWKV
jgi:hypothetical protein